MQTSLKLPSIKTDFVCLEFGMASGLQGFAICSRDHYLPAKSVEHLAFTKTKTKHWELHTICSLANSQDEIHVIYQSCVSGAAQMFFIKVEWVLSCTVYIQQLWFLWYFFLCVPFGHKWPAICKKKSIVYRSVCLGLIERYQDSSLNGYRLHFKKIFTVFIILFNSFPTDSWLTLFFGNIKIF